jgi:hypothetical protein
MSLPGRRRGRNLVPGKAFGTFTGRRANSDEKRPRLEARLFDETGLRLWKQLRADLEGRYTVVYYSQELGEYFETPELFGKAREAANA